MKTVALGRTGMSASQVGLGTWAFASQIYGTVAQSEAVSTIRFALENGVTLYDTAPLYGSATEDGISETILAAGLGSERDDVLISSKFGRYSSDGATADFSARRARESVEGSLARLRTDRIDVLFFHSPFGAHEIHDDVWAELDRLKSEGKIRSIGHSISMFKDTESMARNWSRERRIDVIQVVYSLMNRESAKLINDAAKDGTAIFARESLANGFLSGAITRDTVFSDNNINKRYPAEEIAERVDYVESLSFLVRDDLANMAQASVRWVLDNPDVSLILSGAKNRLELADWIAGANARGLSDAEHLRARTLHARDFQAA